MKSNNIFRVLVVLLIVSIGLNIWLALRSPRQASRTAETTTTESLKQLYTCGMHPNVIQEGPGNCPICGMNLVPLKGNQEKVESAAITIDPATVQNIGVRTAAVQRKDLSRAVVTNGTVTMDESKTFRMNPKFSGWIEKLYVNQTGQLVRKDQPLLDIYSPELVSAQEEYLLALRGYQALASSSSSSTQNNAKNLLAAARDRLKYWDITDDQIASLESSGKPSRVITLYSPAAGVVIEKNVVQGGYAMAGKDLFQIADLSEIWIDAQIYEYELPWVEIGQHAMVKLPSEPGKMLHGKVSYLYPYLDAKIRTATIRLAFPNPNLGLKLDMYVEVQIDSRIRKNVLAIPREAVIQSGKRDVVFLAMGEGKFLPREITLGLEADGSQYEILSGLSEGDRVVTSAQFLLDSEAKLQEALQKLLAAGASEADIHKALGHEGHGDSDVAPPKENKPESEKQPPADHVASGATMDKLFSVDTLYWCPMHHEVVTSDGESRCPICNMFLEKIPSDSLTKLRESRPYGCVMDPVVLPESRKDEKCSVCGMTLKPIEEHPHNHE